MIHARLDGTYTVSVIDKQRMYAFIADVDSLDDAKHIERALKLTIPPQGERQPGPCDNPFSDADCRCSPCVDLDDHICTYIDDGECELRCDDDCCHAPMCARWVAESDAQEPCTPRCVGCVACSGGAA